MVDYITKIIWFKYIVFSLYFTLLQKDIKNTQKKYWSTVYLKKQIENELKQKTCQNIVSQQFLITFLSPFDILIEKLYDWKIIENKYIEKWRAS